MSRLCIFSIYDSDGQIDEYIYYWLKELKTIADEIIVVSNGRVREADCRKLESWAKEVVVRENVGYDAGAYKDVLVNYVGKEKLKQYDSLLLLNDTCYGPFASLAGVFERMMQKSVDYWGLHIWDEGYAYWINSCFIYYDNKILRDDGFFAYFETQIDENSVDMADAYGKFELGLFNFLKEKGYSYDALVKDTHIHMMKAPDKFMELYDFPCLKRRSFCEEHYHEANLQNAMCLVEKTGYPVDYILQNVKRRYKISEDISFKKYVTSTSSEVYNVDYSSRSRKDIIEFIHKNADKTIYIYGAGAFGSRICIEYKKYIDNFGGFVVSDTDRTKVMGENIAGISKLENMQNNAYILGMDRHNSFNVLRTSLKNAQNVLCMFDDE